MNHAQGKVGSAGVGVTDETDQGIIPGREIGGEAATSTGGYSLETAQTFARWRSGRRIRRERGQEVLHRRTGILLKQERLVVLFSFVGHIDRLGAGGDGSGDREPEVNHIDGDL